jgi:hypothetical protein
MHACHERLEQYRVIAETETTQGEAIASLSDRMADVMDQFGNIADRVQGRLALGQQKLVHCGNPRRAYGSSRPRSLIACSGRQWAGRVDASGANKRLVTRARGLH